MMDGMLRRGRATRVLQRIDRPEVIGLSVVLAILAAVGWLVAPFWLAVIVAGQLLLAGIGAVRLIGPAGSERLRGYRLNSSCARCVLAGSVCMAPARRTPVPSTISMAHQSANAGTARLTMRSSVSS